MAVVCRWTNHGLVLIWTESQAVVWCIKHLATAVARFDLIEPLVQQTSLTEVLLGTRVQRC